MFPNTTRAVVILKYLIQSRSSELNRRPFTMFVCYEAHNFVILFFPGTPLTVSRYVTKTLDFGLTQWFLKTSMCNLYCRIKGSHPTILMGFLNLGSYLKFSYHAN